VLGARPLLARAVVAAALLAAGAAAAGLPAGAQPVDGLPDVVAGQARTISPGVQVLPLTRSEPLLQARVARIAPDVVRDRLRLVVSNEAIAEASGARRESTSEMCRRYRCVVGVNADQWYVSGADPSTPIGGTVVDGELWRSPEPDPNPFISMGQLQFDAAGVPDAREAPAGWTVQLEGSTDEGPVTVDLAVNRIPLDGEVALYTPRLGPRTPSDPAVTEWAVGIGAVREGSTTLEPRSGETVGGGNTLSAGGAVLAAKGEAVAVVGAMLAGPVTVRVDLLGARWANGGFPVLFEGGEYTIFPDDPANNAERAARTVAGWTATGELLLVTADRRSGWSAGLTVVEAARLLRTLGAVEAINLDGGGSTTFVEGGYVTNRPSDGTSAPVERDVVDALVIVPPEGIDFATPSPRPAAVACPDGQVPPPPFDDLDTAATHLKGIACAAWRGIASGTGDGKYAPVVDVSRAQMARFIERLLLGSGVGVPGEAPDAFTDDETSVHELAINRLAAMGIVGGVGGGRYDPEGRVTRGQMATFLARAAQVAGAATAPAQYDFFADDPLDLHQPNINLVAELGIAGGVGGTSYDPGGLVSRAQMATFLSRTQDAILSRQ